MCSTFHLLEFYINVVWGFNKGLFYVKMNFGLVCILHLNFVDVIIAYST